MFEITVLKSHFSGILWSKVDRLRVELLPKEMSKGDTLSLVEFDALKMKYSGRRLNVTVESVDMVTGLVHFNLVIWDEYNEEN